MIAKSCLRNGGIRIQINVLADPFSWFLNLYGCLPYPFQEFIFLCLIVAGIIFLVGIWRAM